MIVLAQMAENHHRDWKPSARRLAAPVALALLIAGYHWKLVLTDQFTWLASDDLTSQVLPWLQYQASEWRQGRFPLWDPYIWTGQPLLAQAQPGAANPLHWLVLATPLKHSWIRQAAVHWHYVLIRILAALAFYWLCRGLGRSRLASLFAGSVYGVAGYVGSVDWPQLVSGAIPAPLAFLFQWKAVSSPTRLPSAILSGFFLGLTWLSGHHQLPVYVSITYVCVWIYFIVRDRSLYRYAFLAVLLCFLIGAVQTLPTAEYGRLAVRWSGADHALAWQERVPYSVHELYGLKPLALWSIVVPGLDSGTNPFVGVVVLTLAGAGLAAGWRDIRVRIFAAMIFGSLIFALGPNSFVHGLFYSLVPLLDKARVASHALIIFHVAICVLLAWGIDHFPALPRRQSAVATILPATFGILLATTALILLLARTLSAGGDTRFMVTAFAALAAAGILWGWSNGSLGRQAGVVTLLLLALIEIGNTGGNYTFASYRQKDRTVGLRRMAEDADIVEFLRSAPGHPFRVDYDGEAFPHNIGDWWGIEAFSGNVPSAPAIIMRNAPFNPRVQAMLGVRYYLGTKPLRDDQQEVFTGASGRKVYRNPVAFPRSWVVHSTVRVPVSDTPRWLDDQSLDLAARAIVTREHPPLESCAGDAVRVVEHLPDRVVLQAKLNCRGMVILSETYFPGWRATVGGQAVNILDVNGFVRGIVVEKGDHRIEMNYRPASVRLGLGLTVLGALITLVAAVFYCKEFRYKL